jgi:hypothetical protein
MWQNLDIGKKKIDGGDKIDREKTLKIGFDTML